MTESAKVACKLKHSKDTDLAQHEIALGELHEQVLCAEGIVELRLEVFNLHFGVLEFDERGLVLR